MKYILEYDEGLTVEYSEQELKNLINIRESRDFPDTSRVRGRKELVSPEQLHLAKLCRDLWLQN